MWQAGMPEPCQSINGSAVRTSLFHRCSSTFDTLSELEAHCHSHTLNLKSFKCKFCERRFNLLHRLKEHEEWTHVFYSPLRTTRRLRTVKVKYRYFTLWVKIRNCTKNPWINDPLFANIATKRSNAIPRWSRIFACILANGHFHAMYVEKAMYPTRPWANIEKCMKMK